MVPTVEGPCWWRWAVWLFPLGTVFGFLPMMALSSLSPLSLPDPPNLPTVGSLLASEEPRVGEGVFVIFCPPKQPHAQYSGWVYQGENKRKPPHFAMNGSRSKREIQSNRFPMASSKGPFQGAHRPSRDEQSRHPDLA